MWLCKFFSFLFKICIITDMKQKKKYLQIWNNWKKKLASFFWLDDCAGGICTRERKWIIEILCILDKHGWLMLPKGQLKKWECFEDAAIREFQEETGLYNIKLWKKIGTLRDRLRRKKIVFFEILCPHHSHVAIHDEAILWIPIAKALLQMKHPSETHFVKKTYYWLLQR